VITRGRQRAATVAVWSAIHPLNAGMVIAIVCGDRLSYSPVVECDSSGLRMAAALLDIYGPSLLALRNVADFPLVQTASSVSAYLGK
jgi:hypothetical protein